MVSLEFYLGRKRLTIEQYCFTNGIKSFAALCENLQAAGVSIPKEEQVAPLFVKSPPIVVPPLAPELIIVKSSKRKEDVQ